MQFAILKTVRVLLVGAAASVALLHSAFAADQSSELISITPVLVDGAAVDIVKLANLPEIAVRAELPTSEFSSAEKNELSEIRRDILGKSIEALEVGISQQPTIVTDSEIVVAPTKDADQKLTLKQRSSKIIAFLNEAILKSTYRAGKEFAKGTKDSKGYREYGLSVVLRGLFQVGVGNTNIMKAISRGIELGYDIKSKELVIRTVVRHEQMDGGTALAIGPNIEFRGYRAHFEDEEHLSNQRHAHGKTWYPPAPPLITLASESYEGYHSVGTAFAFNVFDFFIPTYIFNTVNEFDADYKIHRIPLSPVKYAQAAGKGIRSLFTASSRPMANQCQAVFAR